MITIRIEIVGISTCPTNNESNRKYSNAKKFDKLDEVGKCLEKQASGGYIRNR